MTNQTHCWLSEAMNYDNSDSYARWNHVVSRYHAKSNYGATPVDGIQCATTPTIDRNSTTWITCAFQSRTMRLLAKGVTRLFSCYLDISFRAQSLISTGISHPKARLTLNLVSTISLLKSGGIREKLTYALSG